MAQICQEVTRTTYRKFFKTTTPSFFTDFLCIEFSSPWFVLVQCQHDECRRLTKRTWRPTKIQKVEWRRSRRLGKHLNLVRLFDWSAPGVNGCLGWNEVFLPDALFMETVSIWVQCWDLIVWAVQNWVRYPFIHPITAENRKLDNKEDFNPLDGLW